MVAPLRGTERHKEAQGGKEAEKKEGGRYKEEGEKDQLFVHKNRCKLAIFIP